jgi:hypothetical protein
VVAALMPALGSLGEAVLLDSVKRIQPAVSETGKITSSEFETTQALLKMNGFLISSFAMEDVFDGSFTKV